jgi:hypothetical protein
MKRYLLIFGLSVLLLAGFNLRNNSVIVTSVDFPIAEQTALSQQDDSHRADVAREASSLFAPPSTRIITSGERGHVNARPLTLLTIVFTPSGTFRTHLGEVGSDTYGRIACNGSFDRAADYYVYALRHIII